MKRVEAWLSFSLLLILAGSSAAWAAQPQPAQPEKKDSDLLTSEPLKEDPKDDELRKLLKARYNAALTEVQMDFKLYQSARITFDSLAEAQQRLLRARLELCDTAAEKVALLTQFVELSRQSEKVAQARQNAGRATEAEVHRARYLRLDAEIQLLRAKRAAEKSKGK